MNINKVMLFGNLTKDPELKTFDSGSVVCNVSLAVNQSWKDKDGNKQEKTAFINLTIWGKQGEAVAQYIKKGQNAFFEGRLENNDYEDKDGVKHYGMNVVVERFEFGINKKAEEATTASAPAAPSEDVSLDDI